MENTFLSSLARGELSGGREEATLAARLLLISVSIVNITKEDQALILASLINIIANINLIKSAFLEAQAQQISPGVITFANNLKIIGSIGAICVTLTFFLALLTEISIRTQVTGASAQGAAAGGGAIGAFV